MTSRIIMGRRGSAYGMWVSRPGHDVHTAADADLLWSTNVRAFQIVKSGEIHSPAMNANYDLPIPAMGFNPLVLIGGPFLVFYSFPNATTLRILCRNNSSGSIRWAVTNQPLLH